MMQRIFALLLISGLYGCAGSGAAPPATPAPHSQAAEQDRLSREALAQSERCAPAVEWLKDTTNHVLWKGDRAMILQHFEAQRKAGAPEIQAIDIAKEQGKEICAGFVLTLPPGGKRHMLIERHNSFWKSYLGSGASPEDLKDFQVKDEGQSYLHYNFDL